MRDPRYDRGGFIVSKLLTEADARTCVKGEEDKGIGDEVFLYAVIEETVRVEFLRYGGVSKIISIRWVYAFNVPVGPQRSVLLCIKKVE